MLKTIKINMSKCRHGFTSMFADIKKRPVNFLIALMALLLPVFVFADIDPNKDILAGAKSQITANFGPSSTAAWIVYIGEATFCSIKAMRTSNMNFFILAGVLPVATAILWAVI